MCVCGGGERERCVTAAPGDREGLCFLVFSAGARGHAKKLTKHNLTMFILVHISRRTEYYTEKRNETIYSI